MQFETVRVGKSGAAVNFAESAVCVDSGAGEAPAKPRKTAETPGSAGASPSRIRYRTRLHPENPVIIPVEAD